MGLFRTPPRFPADMRAWLDTYGRYRLDQWNCGIDHSAIWDRLEPLLEQARRDPEGFPADLEDLVAGDNTSFATLGAGHVVWEAYNDDALSNPAAARLVDAGIAFKQARGLPDESFAIYEYSRIIQLRGQTPV